MKLVDQKLKGAVILALSCAAWSAIAQAPAFYTGQVVMLEAWRAGNVAFTLNATGVPCNGQFILNKSDPGTKNLYALLVTAKAAGMNIRAYFDGCGPAEGYGSTNYAQVAYMYLESGQ
jgi:hypothetical protein